MDPDAGVGMGSMAELGFTEISSTVLDKRFGTGLAFGSNDGSSKKSSFLS